MATKLLYVSEAPIYGGAERYLLALAEGLDRSRYDISMMVSDQAPDRLRDELEALSVPAIPVPPILGKTDFKGITRHRAIFKTHAPNIVHFNLSNPLHGQYAMLAAQFAGIQNRVATLHLPPRKTTPTRRGRFIEHQTICKLKTLIAVCRASQQLMIDHFGIAPEHTAAIYNGIDVEAFDALTQQSEPPTFGNPNEIILGTVGRLSPQKGYDTLLDAMPQILALVPNTRLIVAGEGPEEENLKTQAQKNGVAHAVDFVGMRADVPVLLTTFDLFVLPSRYESFPISILEVMAAGKPIVSTHVDGIPESVAHNETGLLVAPENSTELAQAVCTLLKDQNLRDRMGKAARERVKAHFTLAQQVAATQNVYATLRAERP